MDKYQANFSTKDVACQWKAVRDMNQSSFFKEIAQATMPMKFITPHFYLCLGAIKPVSHMLYFCQLMALCLESNDANLC